MVQHISDSESISILMIQYHFVKSADSFLIPESTVHIRKQQL